jgi:hypothetical protein
MSALALTACSLGFGLDREQCEKTADCSGFGNAECVDKVCVAIESTGGGGAGGSVPVDPKWDCIGNVEPPDPGGDTVRHVYRFVLAVDESHVPDNLSTQVCAGIDPDCENPKPGFPQPDANGLLELDLPVNDLSIRITSDGRCRPPSSCSGRSSFRKRKINAERSSHSQGGQTSPDPLKSSA